MSTNYVNFPEYMLAHKLCLYAIENKYSLLFLPIPIIHAQSEI